MGGRTVRKDKQDISRVAVVVVQESDSFYGLKMRLTHTHEYSHSYRYKPCSYSRLETWIMEYTKDSPHRKRPESCAVYASVRLIPENYASKSRRSC